MSNLSESKIISVKDMKRNEYKESKQAKWDSSIEAEIKSVIRASLSSASNSSEIFDQLESRFEVFYDRSSNNMLTLRRATKQEKGRWMEHFCLLYLRAKGYATKGIWLLGDVPENILEELKLTRQDFGIDIIAEHENGYFCVQAKWRNRKRKTRIQLTWKQLSTFQALAARSGPWLKNIVMTNCDSVRRAGKKWKMDQTIARAGFRACSREVWESMAGLSPGYSLIDSKTQKSEPNIINDSKASSDDKKESKIDDTNCLVRDDTKRRQAFLDKLSLNPSK